MLRMGMIGGGPGSFIGRVHRTAATMDREAQVVAGVFSSDRQRSLQAGAEIGVDPHRIYANVQEMLSMEQTLPLDERIEFVTVATPNDTHFPFALDALRAGFHVFCDKPMTTSLADAQRLVDQVRGGDREFVLTHNYTGYPMMRLAREMIAQGELGEIQAVRANYIQGWMRNRPPSEKHPRGNWKFDPSRAGPAGAWGDIGVHAFNLVRFVTRLAPRQLQCHLKIFSAGGRLDDYGVCTISAENGALMTLAASQVTHGRGNDLSIEVDGRLGSISWRQEFPTSMFWRVNGRPTRELTSEPKSYDLGGVLAAHCRTPGGLPEGFMQAFANLYRSGFKAIREGESGNGDETAMADRDYPTVIDGWEGVKFIETSLASHSANGASQPW